MSRVSIQLPSAFEPRSWMRQDTLYFGVCIPVRMALPVAVWKAPVTSHGFLSATFFMVAFGFAYLGVTGGRPVPIESMGRGAWWAAGRLQRAGFWAVAGAAVWSGRPGLAAAALLGDVLASVFAREMIAQGAPDQL